jgi:hypothetical protein
VSTHNPGEAPETGAEPGPHDSDRVTPNPPVAPEMQPDAPPIVETHEPPEGEP